MEEVSLYDEDAMLLDVWRVRDDVVALERLVEKYRAPPFSLTFRYVGDVHKAEDCFQETWVRVLSRLDAARRKRRSPGCCVKSFLHAIYMELTHEAWEIGRVGA